MRSGKVRAVGGQSTRGNQDGLKVAPHRHAHPARRCWSAASDDGFFGTSRVTRGAIDEAESRSIAIDRRW